MGIANPYDDPGLKEAWAKGYKAAGKRHVTRASNPYFNQALQQAWNDGFDAKKTSTGKAHRWL